MSENINYVANDLQVTVMRLQEQADELKELYKKTATGYVTLLNERDEWRDIALKLYNGVINSTIKWQTPHMASYQMYKDACASIQQKIENNG